MLPLPVIRERQMQTPESHGHFWFLVLLQRKRVTGPSVMGGGTGQAGACRTACGSGSWGPELTGDVVVT